MGKYIITLSYIFMKLIQQVASSDRRPRLMSESITSYYSNDYKGTHCDR